VGEVYFGNVVSSNLGQAPARQAALGAGIGYKVPCTTVNKVCSSGLKATMLAAQSIQLGHNEVVVCGGMESMSNIPYYATKNRWGAKYGDVQLVDGLSRDGLLDAYDHEAMGVFADRTAEKYGISREEQDRYAIRSYQLAAAATEKGYFEKEITPVAIPQRKGDPVIVSVDEEFTRVNFDKIPGLAPAFTKTGTVTAANASTINDGAAALILVSREKMEALGLTPLARIVSFADAAQEPAWFTTAPTLAAPKALERAGLSLQDVDVFEVNEAFAVVALAFRDVLGVPEDKINVRGGAVSLGHPLGASGARILVTLTHILQQEGRYGLATLCNGGGGASAMVIERV
jgi:acetyl-CoA C-acetyltransferase